MTHVSRLPRRRRLALAQHPQRPRHVLNQISRRVRHHRHPRSPRRAAPPHNVRSARAAPPRRQHPAVLSPPQQVGQRARLGMRPSHDQPIRPAAPALHLRPPQPAPAPHAQPLPVVRHPASRARNARRWSDAHVARISACVVCAPPRFPFTAYAHHTALHHAQSPHRQCVSTARLPTSQPSRLGAANGTSSNVSTSTGVSAPSSCIRIAPLARSDGLRRTLVALVAPWSPGPLRARHRGCQRPKPEPHRLHEAHPVAHVQPVHVGQFRHRCQRRPPLPRLPLDQQRPRRRVQRV